MRNRVYLPSKVILSKTSGTSNPFLDASEGLHAIVFGFIHPCADPEGGGGHGVLTPPKNHKNIGFLSNTGPDPLKSHKATKMAFRWRADDGPLLVLFGSPFPS